MKWCSALPKYPAWVSNGVGAHGAKTPDGGAPPQSGNERYVGLAPAATAWARSARLRGIFAPGQVVMMVV
jgi:hypothetical protein